MARKGAVISIASETSDFERGIKSGVLEPLENAADTMRDLATAGKTSGNALEASMRGAQKDTDKLSDEYAQLGQKIRETGRRGRDLGDGVKDGARTGEDSVERLDDTLDDMGDQAKRSAREAGNAMSRDMGEGASAASEAVAEFGDEAVGNMAETFSSFRGETEDFVQIAQDTFGGIISSLGPLGMAAGAAGAIGIGLFMGSQEKAKEQSEEFKQRVSELTSELIEIGDDPAAAVAKIAEGLQKLATETEEGKAALADLHAASKYTATGYKQLADAATGYGDNIDKVLKAEKKRLESAQENLNHDKRWDQATTQRLIKERDGIETAVNALTGLKEATDEAADAEKAWLASNGPAYEARANQLEAIQGELDATVSSWGDYVNAETGAIDPAKYIAGMAARREGITNFNTNVQNMATQFGLSNDEVQAILDMGLDFAPHLQSIIDAGLTESFVGEVQAAVGGSQEVLDNSELGATVTADADTESAKGDLEATAKPRSAKVTAKSDTKAAASDLDSTADKKRTATLTAKASTSDAKKDLDKLAEKRTADVVASAKTWAAKQDLDALTQPRTAIITADIRDREGKPVK